VRSPAKSMKGLVLVTSVSNVSKKSGGRAKIAKTADAKKKLSRGKCPRTSPIRSPSQKRSGGTPGHGRGKRGGRVRGTRVPESRSLVVSTKGRTRNHSGRGGVDRKIKVQICKGPWTGTLPFISLPRMAINQGKDPRRSRAGHVGRGKKTWAKPVGEEASMGNSSPVRTKP